MPFRADPHEASCMPFQHESDGADPEDSNPEPSPYKGAALPLRQTGIDAGGWILTIDLRHVSGGALPELLPLGSPGRTRTYDHAVNSRVLYQLSYKGMAVMAGLEPATVSLTGSRATYCATLHWWTLLDLNQ